MMNTIIFLVRRKKECVLVNTRDRETAKRYARPYLQGDPDGYIVTPVTEAGDNVMLKLWMQDQTSYPLHRD